MDEIITAAVNAVEHQQGCINEDRVTGETEPLRMIAFNISGQTVTATTDAE